MEDAPRERLDEDTSAWCNRAERFVGQPPGDPFACLAVVCEGIFLRRQWDRTEPDAAARRRLLGLLAAAENVCHQRLAETAKKDAAPDPQRIEHVTRRLAEDDAYLAGLLDDHTIAPETVAFAVECFRDDVHWLGTLVALLDGSRGVDFTGRVLLEQESLQRQIEGWQEEAAVSDQLRESARRLRSTALGRQAEALLNRDRPRDLQDGDLQGWYVAWQAASRLMMRPKGAFDKELQRRIEEYRAEAIERWQEHLDGLPSGQQQETLRRTADDLADVAGESLTFLEDLPLAEAVRGLEIISEDAATCTMALKTHAQAEQKRLQRRLRRRRKALAAELQERRLNWRMEGLFGRRAVAALERLILVLLIVFVLMLVVEIQYEQQNWPGSNRVVAFMAWADLVICMVFLAEFTLKMGLARPRQLFLRRNWVTMLVPSIPFGFIMYVALSKDALASVEAAETIVLLRLFRLPRMIRFLRFARPLIRMARLLAFIMQASDRLVRRVAPLLNRNLVLFDQAAVEVRQPAYRTALASLRERFFYRASEAAAELLPAARSRLVRSRIDDLTAMLSAPQVGMVTPVVRSEASTIREIPLEGVIARLLAATPAGISDRIGRTLAQSVARWCRAFDVLAVRRLPVIRDLVAAGRRSSPYGATAQVANRIGGLLNRWLDRLYWIADLYGTLTAPQLVDSIGDWMVKSTARPARRLLLIGGLFLLVTTLASWLPFPERVQEISGMLERMIGTPLIVLGLICLLPLLLGLWFRQIAGEATDFCTHVAEAQFITATKQLKRRFAQRHREILNRRVLKPERAIGVAGAKRSGAPVARHTGASQAQPPATRSEEPRENDDPTRQAVELLFEDYLDGAPFHCSDTKTTTQLLGNLALVSLRETRLGCDRRQRKRLRRLDLAATRSWLRGPYLWFHFISRSIAQQTAKLVVDYNAHALPLDRAEVADDGQIRRYVHWLAGRLHQPVGRVELADAFRTRWEAIAGDENNAADEKPNRRPRDFHANDFTAIHFLSADDDVEADVRRRYGDAVAGLMRRDRRDNVRRVFRTFPLHRWPKQQRTFNPLAVYDRYFAGGRVLLLPLRAVWWTGILSVRAVWQFGRFVRDVLYPSIGDLDPLTEPDPYAVAVRKIYRMRKPVFMECLRMRARFDPEYLGASLPSTDAVTPCKGDGVRSAASPDHPLTPSPDHPLTPSPDNPSVAPIEEDLATIGADPGQVQEFRQLAAERRRQLTDFQRLLTTIDGTGFSAESLRAMAVAYTIDYRCVRSRVEATRRLRHALEEIVADSTTPGGTGRGLIRTLRAWWCRGRHAGKTRRLFNQPAFADFDAAGRKASARAIYRRRGNLLAALRTLAGKGIPDDPVAAARTTLLSIARDPAPWSRQLVTLRAVQTLSVLDLQTYCDLVAELGEYDTFPPENPETTTYDE